MEINLVIVWAMIIIFGLSMYVLSDGFDLGVGLLFLCVRDAKDREVMMNRITRVWDGSEAWLVLVAICFAVAFPPTLSVLLKAFSLPLLGMVFGLVVRGIAFQLRSRNQRVWDTVFCFGSMLATFFQGVILGALIQGISVEGGVFIGGLWDWFTWFSVLTGLTLLLAYALLGATWLLITTDGVLYRTMRHYSHHLLGWFGYAIMLVTVITPFLNEIQRERWFALPNFFYMGFVPMFGIMGFVWVYFVIRFSDWQRWPFAITLMTLGTAFLTYITCLWPKIVLPDMSIYEMAAFSNSHLGHSLWGIVLFILAIFAYSFWAYQVSFGRALIVLTDSK